jgi:hypothetical protein
MTGGGSGGGGSAGASPPGGSSPIKVDDSAPPTDASGVPLPAAPAGHLLVASVHQQHSDELKDTGAGGGAGANGGNNASPAGNIRSAVSSMHMPSGGGKAVDAKYAAAAGNKALFEIPDVDAVVAPKSRWRWSLDLSFIEHPQLEADFQADYFQRFLAPNRGWLGKLTMALLLLAIFDTLANLEGSNDNLVRSYIFRAVGVAAGLACYLFSYSRHYERVWQLASASAVTVMGVMLIQIGIQFGFYLQAYGVALVLLLLGLVGMFMGFTFVYALGTSIALLLMFLISSLARGDNSGPIFFLLAGMFIYVRTTWSSDSYVRVDYVRLLKRKNEERRTRHFLANMLPVVVVDELKREAKFIAHQFRLASVSFCDVVSFTTLAARITPIVRLDSAHTHTPLVMA